MHNFTPLSASIGGLIIGLSAVLLMGLNGRIAGISGIFSGMVSGKFEDRLWKVLFVIGLVLGPMIYTFISGIQPEFSITSNWALIIFGGLLVGFGTRLGSGCTSGHGVCGLARFSPRSLFSVMVFMASGVATVAFARAIFGG